MGVCDHSWGLGVYQPVRIPIKRVCGGYYLRWYYNGWHYWFFIPGNYYKVTEGENYRTIGTRKVVLATGQVTLAQAKAIRTIINTREVYLWTVAGWMNIRIEPGIIIVHTNMVNAVEFEIVALIGSKEISLPTGYSPIDDVPDIPPPEFETYCEIVIGSQVWMCRAWDIGWPGMRTYNMDIDNKDIYGGLYTFDMINSPGFCPTGWHVPTLDEWQECITFIGGLAGAAGILKEVGFIHWYAPNTGAVDTYAFAQRSTGYSRGLDEFYGLYESALLWTKTEVSRTLGRAILMSYDSAAITINSIIKTRYCGVRLLKDSAAPPFTNINDSVTLWTDDTTWPTFISAGRNITSAIANAGVSEYTKSNDIVVVSGTNLEMIFNVTINSGSDPQLYIWDKDHNLVIASTNVLLSAGINTVRFTVPAGCTTIYCMIINVINFAPPALAVNFSLTMP